MIFLKQKAIGEFGIEPEKRSPESRLKYSIINLDKPKGPTSHQISDTVKKIVKINKAGHSGTLDPGVCGVQPVAIGNATRLTQYLLTAPKEYICLMHIHKDLDQKIIRHHIQKFIGKIQQLPPVKSAVKRQIRTREIYELEIIQIKGREVLFRVQCQAGTYIRKLCHDLGKSMDSGAHMAELRRTQAGPFTEQDNLVTLQDLTDAIHFYKEENNSKFLLHCLQPVEKAIAHFPKCWILDTTIKSVTHGRDIGIPGISKLENFRKDVPVAILTLKGELVAMGRSLMSAVEINSIDKGLAITTEKVFIRAI